MKAIDALKEAANSSGIPVAHIGLKLGRRPNYVSGIATRGSTPQANTLASMLSVCGYVLAALPADQVPESALVIDPVGTKSSS